MRPQDPQPRLDELRLAAQRISANLVELEIDPSRQLLQAARLTGRSAERWAGATASLTELWRRQALLEALIERADHLRGARHRDELRSMLEGASIELSSGSVPLAERQLLGTARSAERCSPDQLLAWMAGAFGDVQVAIAELTETWERFTPKLEKARRLAAESRQLADQVGEPLRDDLEIAELGVGRLTQQLAGDPLSVNPQEVEDLEHELRSLRSRLAERASLKLEFESRMGDAHQRLVRLRGLVESAREAQRELVLRIELPSPQPPPLELDHELEAELQRVGELGGEARWSEASRALRDWTERIESEFAQARQRLDASRAPIQARNQFRALLDAYKVKAERLGRLEDPELQQSFAEAHEVLYNAPSDLTRGAELVRSVQLALTDSDPAPEVTA